MKAGYCGVLTLAETFLREPATEDLIELASIVLYYYYFCAKSRAGEIYKETKEMSYAAVSRWSFSLFLGRTSGTIAKGPTVQLGRLLPTWIRWCLDSIRLFLITTSNFYTPYAGTNIIDAYKSTQLYNQLKKTHDILCSNGTPTAPARASKKGRRG